MTRLLQILLRFGNALTFILLEIICFYLIINYNPSQNEIYIHSANLISGKILKEKKQVLGFWDLQKTNDSLLNENARLYQELLALKGYGEKIIAPEALKFDVTPAQITNQSIHFRNNYISVAKGSTDGIEKNQGVVSEKGVVGVVQNVSPNYARILSILNTEARLSGIVKNKEYFGNLRWDGNDRSKLILNAIPKHANIAIGDTVTTSGYSSIFPAGINIGVIDDFYVPRGSANFLIQIKLFTDFSNLQHVFILKNNDPIIDDTEQ